MKNESWVNIYTTTMLHQAEIAIQILEDHGILAVKINKRDSSYNAFGDIEVHVKQSNVIKAKQLIKKLEEH